MADFNINILEEIPNSLPCNATSTPNQSSGIYTAIFDVGEGTGDTGIAYNAFGVPDRFRIIYNGAIVADSKYVGDSLANSTTDLLTGSPWTLSKYEYTSDGQGGGDYQLAADQSGNVLTITNSDIANGTSTEPTIGTGSLIFTKFSPQPSFFTVITEAPLGGTAWNINSICPGSLLAPSAISIATGDCDELAPVQLGFLYIQGTNLVDGVVIYQEPTFNTPYNGLGAPYTLNRTNNTSINVGFNPSNDVVTFNIDSNGVVNNIAECTPPL